MQQHAPNHSIAHAAAPHHAASKTPCAPLPPQKKAPRSRFPGQDSCPLPANCHTTGVIRCVIRCAIRCAASLIQSLPTTQHSADTQLSTRRPGVMHSAPRPLGLHPNHTAQTTLHTNSNTKEASAQCADRTLLTLQPSCCRSFGADRSGPIAYGCCGLWLEG